MEAEWPTIVIAAATVVVLLSWGWRVLNWLWLRPKKLERLLREQGLRGTPYKVLVGDSKDFMKMQREARTKPMNTFDDDLVPRTQPFVLQCFNKYGKNSFFWSGGIPRVIVTDPELIKDVFNKIYDFSKPDTNPLIKLLVNGLAGHEGEKWSKHRRIINPAFHLEKLKIMIPIFFKSCNEIISKWEKMLSLNESCEMDVWPFLQNLTSDVISRAAFGSSYEEGIRIFELQREQLKLTMEVVMKVYIPGWRTRDHFSFACLDHGVTQ